MSAPSTKHHRQSEKNPSSNSSKASSSKMSIVSIEARKKVLELKAAEEKARLRIAAEEVAMKAQIAEAKAKAKLEDLKMQAQMDLVDKKLSASLAELEEQGQRRSRACSSVSSVFSTLRTGDWVAQAAQQNETLRRTIVTPNARCFDPAAQDDTYAAPAAALDDGCLPSAKQHVPCSTFCPALQNKPSSSPVSQDQAILKLADAVHDLAKGCAHSCNQVNAVDKLMSRFATPKDLPYFKGDPMEWINFKNSYEESTKICQFSNIENVCRLRKSLIGEAKDSVSALLMGDISAENIMKTLELRFGRPEIIIQKIVSQLKKLPLLSLSYHNDIVSFSIKVKNCVVAAKAIKQDDYLRSPDLITVMLSKLPCVLIARWADYAYDRKGEISNVARLEQLSQFLDVEAQKISDVGVSLLQPTIRKYESPVYSIPQRTHTVLALAQTKGATKCSFCHKHSDHIISDCPKFKRALRKDRWSFVRGNRLCPKCLVSDHNKFSKIPTTDDEKELKVATVAVITPVESTSILDTKRFSSWMRLLRATATLWVAIERLKGSIVTIDGEHMNKAELFILKQAQRESYSDEINMLKDKKPMPKKSRISTLTPYLDDDGILRVQGRIDAAADVALETKRPVILDGRSHVSRLIILHYHVRAAHGNNETVINELRQRYWIVHLRPSVRSVASKCLICRIRKATPVAPRQGDLPAGRVAHHCRPFSHCGLDLFGPIDVTVGRRREKRYGVIFTCMTVRAIHLEVVHSLSTDSLIMSLRRMAGRRGWPTDLYSDNGTNLRGADTVLKALYNEASNNRVRWHFNPPLSPHMGGAWERLIRSVKSSLKVILKERAPRDETLLTLLCEVEAIVNSRPLTHVSVNSVDDVALTPFHFLLGTSSNLPISTTQNSDLCSRKQWRVAQRLADMFWARWLKEVLPTMLPHTMKPTSDKELKVGDVVLVADPTAERNCWPRGVIDAVYPGADGRVRVVDVRSSRGTLRRRAAQRLARLPSNPRGEEC